MGGPGAERGYFGPWTTCKELLYGRTKCGENVSRFRPHGAVKLAGYVAALNSLCLAFFCILSIIQLSMIVSKDKVVLKYTSAVTAKLGLALLSTMFGIATAGLFALQTDDRANDFIVKRGESFYIQLCCGVTPAPCVIPDVRTYVTLVGPGSVCYLLLYYPHSQHV
ncbi:hypothetical protein J6590_050610 [Homalodisca vitripennis]|nr:hypothetical protein J6590_050610 [Homalodisca vitripennis]